MTPCDWQGDAAANARREQSAGDDADGLMLGYQSRERVDVMNEPSLQDCPEQALRDEALPSRACEAQASRDEALQDCEAQAPRDEALPSRACEAQALPQEAQPSQDCQAQAPRDEALPSQDCQAQASPPEAQPLQDCQAQAPRDEALPLRACEAQAPPQEAQPSQAHQAQPLPPSFRPSPPIPLRERTQSPSPRTLREGLGEASLREAVPQRPPFSASLSSLVPPSFAGVWRDLFAGGHDEYWLAGGRGSGKSTFAAAAVVLTLLRSRDACAIVYRKVQATLRDSVFAQLLWVIERLGMERLFAIRLSPLELTYQPTGQRVLFRGADDPAKSKGIKLKRGYFGALWLEELSEFESREEIDVIRQSVLRGGGHAVTICTYNPPISRRAWVNAAAARPEPTRLTHRSDYRSMPREWLGEPFLRQAEATRLRDERAYRHMYLGEPIGAGGAVFGNLSLCERIEHCTARRWFGLDFGFAGDPDALIVCALDRKRRVLYLLDELVERGLTIEQLAQGVRDKLSLAQREASADGETPVVTCDCADPRMIAELRRRGVTAVASRKGAGSVMHGVRYLQSLDRIEIDATRCPVAAREFSLCEYRRVGDELLPEIADRDNHTIDATRYALEGLMGGIAHIR